jgi:hypothetical protein
VDFNAANTQTNGWRYGKRTLVAGAAYWYRNELFILARAILAGANLAIERWEEQTSLNASKQASLKFYKNNKTNWKSESTQTSTASQVHGGSILNHINKARATAPVKDSSATLPSTNQCTPPTSHCPTGTKLVSSTTEPFQPTILVPTFPTIPTTPN